MCFNQSSSDNRSSSGDLVGFCEKTVIGFYFVLWLCPFQLLLALFDPNYRQLFFYLEVQQRLGDALSQRLLPPAQQSF